MILWYLEKTNIFKLRSILIDYFPQPGVLIILLQYSETKSKFCADSKNVAVVKKGPYMFDEITNIKIFLHIFISMPQLFKLKFNYAQTIHLYALPSAWCNFSL